MERNNEKRTQREQEKNVVFLENLSNEEILEKRKSLFWYSAKRLESLTK
jgi:hypothetical protein